MILTGPEITDRVRRGEITIDPFDLDCVSPNSYDFHLSADIAWYTGEVLDCRADNPLERGTIPKTGRVLHPHRIYLVSTAETMGSCSFVPIIRARSSIARLGLFIHVTADLIDIGSVNRWTLQLHAVQPVRVYPDMRVGQVTFWRPLGEIELYDGKYRNSTLPEPSQAFRDFERVT